MRLPFCFARTFRTSLSVLFCLVAAGVIFAVPAGAQVDYRNAPPVPSRRIPGVHLGRPSQAISARPAPDAAVPQAAAPVFSVAPGSYPSAQTVTITDATPGATIYYTTNGTYPGSYSAVYSAPVPVASSEILVAFAIASGYANSHYASAEYLIASSSDRYTYTIAGNGLLGYSGDGGPATLAALNSPQAALADNKGNVYVADSYNNRVRKVDASGVITTIAGTGAATDTGDGGPAIRATLWYPQFLALDGSGNLYIAETGDSVVRKLNLGSGVITTAAGSPTGTATNSGPAASLKLTGIIGLACDPAGNLFVGEELAVLAIDPSGNTTELAGLDTIPNYPIGDGPGFAIDASRNIYLFESGHSKIYKIDSARNMTLFAGTGFAPGGDGGPATKAGFGFNVGLAVDKAGNLYVGDAIYETIREINAQTGIINTVAGVFADPFTVGGDGDPSTSSGLFNPLYLSVDAAGDIYLADSASRAIRKITAPAPPPTVAAAAPSFSPAGGTFASAQSLAVTDSTTGAAIYLSFNGAAAGSWGQEYHGDINLTGTATINAIAVSPGYLKSAVSSADFIVTQPPTEVISTVAGNGTYGLSGAGGPATSAQMGTPRAVAFKSDGDLYIADQGNSVIWLVSAASGNISVVAGTGTSGFAGDGGPAGSALLNNPTGVALDNKGNLYIADSFNGRVRMVSASTGIISTYAGGTTQVTANWGDGGPATAANLQQPEALALDSFGNLYIADTGHLRVRVVAAGTGIISTYAGGATSQAQLGDGGPATSAYVLPVGLAFDGKDNLYIVDQIHSRIRYVDAKTGIIATIAGGGSGSNADGAPAAGSAISPDGVAVDSQGAVYLSDWALPVVRKINPDGTLATIAGNGYFGYSGDGGSATIASVSNPAQLSFDPGGSLYIPDAGDYVVRKVRFPSPAATPSLSLAGGSYAGAQTVTVASMTTNAAIYFTTDGSTPTTGSTLYSGPVIVAQSETLQAIAVASGYTASAVAKATYTITMSNPVIVLTSSTNPAFVSNGVTFAATIGGTPGTPTGTVTFFDGNTQLGTGTLASGIGTYTTSSLTAGMHGITAAYSGDVTFNAATSLSLTQTVEDFTFAVPSGSSTSATISKGGAATYTLAVNPPSGSTSASAITFTVAGLPTGATAAFSPATVAAGSGPTNVTFTVSVPASAAARAAAAVHHARTPGTGAMPLALGVLLLPLLGFRRTRRALAKSLLLVLALAGVGGVIVMSGCGGSGTGTPVPQPQIYALTVTATAGSLSHTSGLTLTLQ